MFLLIAIIALIISIVSFLYGYSDDVTWMKFAGLAFLIAASVCTIFHFNTEQGARLLKDISSNTSGGLNRTVEVYDQNGNLIKTYEGRLDVQGNRIRQ